MCSSGAFRPLKTKKIPCPETSVSILPLIQRHMELAGLHFSFKRIYLLLLRVRFEIHKLMLYRVSINSFPDYKHLLQENYVKYKLFFSKCNSTEE